MRAVPARAPRRRVQLLVTLAAVAFLVLAFVAEPGLALSLLPGFALALLAGHGLFPGEATLARLRDRNRAPALLRGPPPKVRRPSAAPAARGRLVVCFALANRPPPVLLAA